MTRKNKIIYLLFVLFFCNCDRKLKYLNLLDIEFKQSWKDHGDLYQFRRPKSPSFKLLGVDGNILIKDNKLYSLLYLKDNEQNLFSGNYSIIDSIVEGSLDKPFLFKITLINTDLQLNDTVYYGNNNWILLKDISYNHVLSDSVYYFLREFGNEKVGMCYSKKYHIIGLSKFGKTGVERFYGFNRNTGEFNLNSIELYSADSCKKISPPNPL